MIHYIDHMPDNLHPGPKTNIIAAEWLAEQLKAQNFLDQIMKERGISALGKSQPLRQQINRRGRFGV